MGLVLDFEEDDLHALNLFSHAGRYDEGVGLERRGKSYIVVSQDGSGDCDNLREAYTQLNKNGGKIFIKDGTYILKSTLEISGSNISIEGSGISTIIQGNEIDPLIRIKGTNNQIKNCTIQNPGSTTTDGTRVLDISGCNLIKIDKCYFSGFNANIILRGGSIGCVISNNTFNSQGAYGLRLINASNNIIENNYVNGSLPEADIYLDANSNQNLISKNLLTGDMSTMLVGVWILGSQNIISQNQISSMAENGVYIQSGDSNVITENFFNANTTNYTNNGTNTQIGHNTTI